MKKSFFLIITLLFVSFLGYAQNADYSNNVKSPVTENTNFSPVTSATWSAIATSPHAVSRSCCAAIKRGDTIFVYQFGGGAGTQLTNVAKWNSITNTWTNNVTVIPFMISAGSAVAMPGDSIIYVIGGNNSPAVYGKCLKYNVLTNIWTTMADMTTNPCTDQLTAVYRDSLIFCVGGGDGLFGTTIQYNTVRIYNTKTNTWSTATNLPITLSMSGGGIIGDTIYVFSGASAGSYVANSYKGVINPANISTITWTTLPAYPGGAITRMASHKVKKGNGGGIMCSGGAIGGATLSSATYLYNPCTQSWQTLPSNSLARSNFKGTGLNDSVAYIIAGYTTTGTGVSEKITFSQIDGSCLVSSSSQNLCRNGLNIAIPDNSPIGAQDTILVSIPSGGNIVDINVKMDTIMHTFDADLDVTFIHGAIEDTLFHDVGSLGDNFIGTILDDSATTPIQSCAGVSTCAPFTGSYIPANLLSNMNGLPVNGIYILRLRDDLGGDIGTLKGWCITVTYSTATGVIGTVTIPSKYTLSQNYPNPFNPVTKINYGIAKQGLVSLKVYDVLGREIATLVNGVKEAGAYTIDFNASELSSGVYFYKLESNGFVSTKKMTVIK